jgi:hypothetical protein
LSEKCSTFGDEPLTRPRRRGASAVTKARRSASGSGGVTSGPNGCALPWAFSHSAARLMIRSVV